MNQRTTAVSAAILAGVAITIVLYLGRVVFVPMALALLLAAVLRPAVARLEAARVPAPAGAALILLGGLAVALAGGLALSGPAQEWARKVPEAAAAAGKKVEAFRRRFDRFGSLLQPPQAPPKAADSTEEAVPPAGGTAPAAPSSPSPPAAGPSLTPLLGRVFGTTTEIVSTLVETVLLLFFLLAAGRTWHERMIKAAPSPAAGKKAVQISGEIQQALSHYLLVTLLINVGQGILVGFAMALAGMPAPALWGLLTVFAEFIPYAGGLVMVILLTLVGLAGSDSVGHVLLAPGLYLLITTLQNNLVSPFAYGERLRLNPLAILVSLMVWYFLWGVPGAFLAVPIAASFKILCDRVESLHKVGVFLEQ